MSPAPNGMSHHCWLIPVLIVVALTTATIKSTTAEQSNRNNNINRKSIVFDIKTPKVFYCPQEKPADLNKMIVKAKPLDKLCEFGGKSRPKNEASDCYNDVDESDFACDEKKRFMKRLDLSSELDSSEGIDDLDFIVAKAANKKRAASNGKKY